jgi:capsular polysaccharide biosynthesis protein
LIEEYIEDVERLTTQIPGVESQLKKFYNGLQSSQNNVDNWRDRLRNAVVWKEVSKAEGSNNILILESAEEPKKPIKMTNVLLFRLVIGAALGLVLGVLAAFLFSYMRGVNREEQET